MEGTSEVLALVPIDSYRYFPSEDQKKIGEGKKLIRWIFEGETTFEDFENQQLDLLYQEMTKQNVKLPEGWRRSDSLKFLIACAFNLDKSSKGIQEYISWRASTLPIELTPAVTEFLNSGIMYHHGRDHRFRPIIYFNCYKLDTKEPNMDQFLLSMGYFLEYMIQHLLLPGQVERWVIVLDLKGMGLTSLPFGMLKTVLGFLQNNFRSRLFKMYIMNSPTSLYFSWKMIKGLLEETTTQKINFSKESVNEDLWKHTNKSQVEEKFGGTAKNIEAYWPPKVPSSDYLLSGEDASKVFISKEEYQTKHKDGGLDKYKVCRQLLE